MQACTATRHGDTHTAYTTWRCRCPGARRAGAVYRWQKANGTHQPKLVTALGTGRRIRALMAAGWSQAQIGEAVGLPASMISHLSRTDRLMQATADRVAEVYDKLSADIPPRTRGGTYARNMAMKRGWAPPLAWDNIDDPEAVPQSPEDSGAVDEVAVRRRLSGDQVKLNAAERAEVKRHRQERASAAAQRRAQRQAAVRDMYSRGFTVMETATALVMDRSTVLGIYNRLRKEAV